MSKKRGKTNCSAGSLREWTIIGPIPSTPGIDPWIPLELDWAASAPRGIREVNGHSVQTRLVGMEGISLDFRTHLPWGGESPQAFAFSEFAAPEDGTLTLTYDADWSVVWWIDGNEVFATRNGNGGGVVVMKHKVMVALPKGRHVVTVRVISGRDGWALFIHSVEWRAGIVDELRTDRGAAWRDYARTSVRHENRPLPDGTCGEATKEQYELLLANLGVDARWIGVSHHHIGSYYPSKHLPMWPGATPEHEKQLHEWVKLLHDRRVCAMSWLALSECAEGWRLHPEWRQQYLVPPPAGASHAERMCCVNTPYGEALINYAVEAIQRFDLDGLWFDGACFTSTHITPRPLSCVCPYCNKKFTKETGLEAPGAPDWSNPVFPRWVQWRYDMFSEYWQRLVDRIHEAVPQARVVFNHYHREGCGWNGAIPLKPFGHDFVSGTEADGEPLKGAFYTRCMRAYGRVDSEVWMGLGGVRKNTVKGPRNNPRMAMDFAIACATAGGHASTGGSTVSVEAPVLGRIADELKPREPYVGLPSVPYAALHLSQQSETFVFGRNPTFHAPNWTDFYWNSLTGWHHVLAHAGLTCDVVYDAHLTPKKLSDYPLLVMPLAPALMERQYRTVLSYVEQGGTLLAGPWFGVSDEWGVPRKRPLGDRNVFPFGHAFPSWLEIENRHEIGFYGDDTKGKMRLLFKSQPLGSLSPDQKRIELGSGTVAAFQKITRLGKGKIIQFAFDWGGLFRQTKSKEVVEWLRDCCEKMVRPLVKVDGGEGLMLGVFRNEKQEVVVHVQQFPPSWQGAESAHEHPPTRWNAALVWNGAKPRSVRCALPELGPELPVARKGGSWSVALPPFVWGQIIVIR